MVWHVTTDSLSPCNHAKTCSFSRVDEEEVIVLLGNLAWYQIVLLLYCNCVTYKYHIAFEHCFLLIFVDCCAEENESASRASNWLSVLFLPHWTKKAMQAMEHHSFALSNEQHPQPIEKQLTIRQYWIVYRITKTIITGIKREKRERERERERGEKILD